MIVRLLDTLLTVRSRTEFSLRVEKSPQAGQGVAADSVAWIEWIFPSVQPDWDPDTDQGKEVLDSSLQALLGGLTLLENTLICFKVNEVIQ